MAWIDISTEPRKSKGSPRTSVWGCHHHRLAPCLDPAPSTGPGNPYFRTCISQIHRTPRLEGTSKITKSNSPLISTRVSQRSHFPIFFQGSFLSRSPLAIFLPISFCKSFFLTAPPEQKSRKKEKKSQQDESTKLPARVPPVPNLIFQVSASPKQKKPHFPPFTLP